MGGEIFFLHSGHSPRCTATVDKHFDGYWSLQLMTRGGVRLSYDDKSFELRGAWMWPCWPGPRIQFGPLASHRHWAHRYVAFRGPLASRWFDQGMLRFEPQRPVPVAAFVRQFDLLLTLVRRNDIWGRLRAVNVLEAILLQLAEQRRDAITPWLDQVERLLERQATLWPKYDLIAREMAIGLSTLRRRYRQQTGTSLHTAVLRRRITTAQSLLGNTALPIKEIARQLGYHDVYFFSRQFRQLAGISPAAFRRSRQN